MRKKEKIDWESLNPVRWKYSQIAARVNETIIVLDYALKRAKALTSELEKNLYEKEIRMEITIYLTFYEIISGTIFFEIIPILICFYVGINGILRRKGSNGRYEEVLKFVKEFSKKKFWLKRGPREPLRLIFDNSSLEVLPVDIARIAKTIEERIKELDREEADSDYQSVHARHAIRHRVILLPWPELLTESMFRGGSAEKWREIFRGTELEQLIISYTDGFKDLATDLIKSSEDDLAYTKAALKTIYEAVDSI